MTPPHEPPTVDPARYLAASEAMAAQARTAMAKLAAEGANTAANICVLVRAPTGAEESQEPSCGLYYLSRRGPAWSPNASDAIGLPVRVALSVFADHADVAIAHNGHVRVWLPGGLAPMPMPTPENLAHFRTPPARMLDTRPLYNLLANGWRCLGCAGRPDEHATDCPVALAERAEFCVEFYGDLGQAEHGEGLGWIAYRGPCVADVIREAAAEMVAQGQGNAPVHIAVTVPPMQLSHAARASYHKAIVEQVFAETVALRKAKEGQAQETRRREFVAALAALDAEREDLSEAGYARRRAALRERFSDVATPEPTP